MSAASMQVELDKIIAKGDAKKIIPSNYKGDEAAVYAKELNLYNAYKAAMESVKKELGTVGDAALKVATLQEKKENAETNKSFTAEDEAALLKAIKDRNEIMTRIDAITAPNAAEAQKLSDELRTAQLKAIAPTGKPGELNYVKPENLAEYIIRTQALNPYSRERECDIRFLKLIAFTAGEAKKIDKEVLQALKDLIKERVLAS